MSLEEEEHLIELGWSQRKTELCLAAMRWGIDMSTAIAITDLELSAWTADELSAVLKRVKGLARGKVFNTMETNSGWMSSLASRFSQLTTVSTPNADRIKAPMSLVAAAVQGGLALCINRRGDISLKESGYVAISHVWSEGIQGHDDNSGVSRSCITRIFEKVAPLGVDWVWVDVLAIPSGNRTLSATEELHKAGSINNLAKVYESAVAVVIFDALVMQLQSTDPVDVAVALLCGKWMTRVWTYQEILLASRAVIVTASGIVEFNHMLEGLKVKNNGLGWQDGDEPSDPEQLQIWLKYRMLCFRFDMLTHNKQRTMLGLPDISFSCNRRVTGNEIDYVRAFFPVLELQWKVGMTKEEGMKEIYEKHAFGYNNAIRVMLMTGRPRCQLWPGWAPDRLCGLEGRILEREVRFHRQKRGLQGEWHTLKILRIAHNYVARRAVFTLQDQTTLEEVQCAGDYAAGEQQETLIAIDAVVQDGNGFFLTHDPLERSNTAALVAEREVNAPEREVYVYFVFRIMKYTRQYTAPKETWLLRSENPMNKTADGGKRRAETFCILDAEFVPLNETGPAQELPRGLDSSMSTAQPSDGMVNAAQSYRGRTGLHIAAISGDINAAKLLIAEATCIDAIDSDGFTPLNWAADKGHDDVVKLLLDAGADINHVGLESTPLADTILGKRMSTTTLLLQNGADPNCTGKFGWWPLIYACEKPEYIELLLNHGADPNKSNAAGWTAVMFAARADSTSGIEKLVARGADVDGPNVPGKQITPLEWACANHAQNAVMLLLHHKANPNVRLRDGRTAIISAAETGNVVITQALLSAGADVDAADTSKGWTALHFAAHNGRRVVAKILKEHGARLDAKDLAGLTPFALAVAQGHGETAEVMRF